VSKEVKKIKEMLAPYKPCFDIDTSMSLDSFLDMLQPLHIQWGLRCSKELYPYLRDQDLAKLTGSDWVKILCRHPELREECPWFKLSSSDMEQLLEKKPSLAKYIPLQVA